MIVYKIHTCQYVSILSVPTFPIYFFPQISVHLFQFRISYPYILSIIYWILSSFAILCVLIVLKKLLIYYLVEHELLKAKSKLNQDKCPGKSNQTMCLIQMISYRTILCFSSWTYPVLNLSRLSIICLDKQLNAFHNVFVFLFTVPSIRNIDGMYNLSQIFQSSY